MKKMHHKVAYVVLPALVLMAFVPHSESVLTQANTAGPTPVGSQPCTISNNTFQDGEEIVYKLFYNWNFVWLSAGEVTFRVKETADQYYISAVGHTYKSYEWFFKVRDRYETYINKRTMLPDVSIREVQEGKYSLYDKVTFDKKRNKAISLRGKSKDVATPSEYDVQGCIHDIISIIYYCRNIDFQNLQIGAEIPIQIFMDKKTWPLKVIYKGKEKGKRIHGQGKFDVVRFSPEVIEGYVFKKGTEMNIWAGDDKNKIPLLIESPVSVGSVKVVLKSYKGLRYNFEATSDK